MLNIDDDNLYNFYNGVNTEIKLEKNNINYNNADYNQSDCCDYFRT